MGIASSVAVCVLAVRTKFLPLALSLYLVGAFVGYLVPLFIACFPQMIQILESLGLSEKAEPLLTYSLLAMVVGSVGGIIECLFKENLETYLHTCMLAVVGTVCYYFLLLVVTYGGQGG